MASIGRRRDLSVEEIRYWIVRKRRVTRTRRLEHFWRTGRVRPLPGEWDEIRDTPARSERRPRTWIDRALLGAELLAILSLVAVMGSGLSVLRALNQSMAAALQQPTLQPTPLVSEIVLPEGHTPPNSPGGARPNVAEIPENLRPVFFAAQALPIPTSAPHQAIRIQIPAIGVDAPVVQGDSWEQLKKGVAQHAGTPNPGEIGNIVLSGHNDVFGEVFRDLDRLQPGDQVIVLTSQRRYVYVITGTQLVEPTAVEVMAPTPDQRVTLISCHPYLVDVHRIIVTAILQSS
jgi:sortase A